MRSDRPIPGNPWPHDMVITVEDRPQSLLDILWVREAYELVVDGDVPPPLTDTPEPAVAPIEEAVRAGWAKEWPELWMLAARHAGHQHDPELFSRLTETANGSPERAELLRSMAGPSWRDDVGADAFEDPSHRAWQQRKVDADRAPRRRTLADSPEHRDLEALIPAWRAGLTKIVTIPCRGTYTRRLGRTGLLVTGGTRDDSDAYRQALREFAKLEPR